LGAAMLAFTVAAAIDWAWELAVVPICFVLLAAALLADGTDEARQGHATSTRMILVSLSLLALIAIAIPLASTSSVRASQASAQASDLEQALDSARRGTEIEPWAASPKLQEALVLELQGSLNAAATAARAATDEEPVNWRTWLVLSRLEAFRGNSDEAVAAYREARSLNPRSPLFAR
jgi:cytochrome c-type biogenesis protein CcmH/NrfG